MDILTSKQRWYQRNKAKANEQARLWRLNNLERFRAMQRAYKQRKHKPLAAPAPVELAPTAGIWVPAPGYDAYVHGDYGNWCLARGLDPTRSWHDAPEDTFFA